MARELSTARYNGKLGTVIEYNIDDADVGRYVVQLDSSGELVAVPPTKLLHASKKPNFRQDSLARSLSARSNDSLSVPGYDSDDNSSVDSGVRQKRLLNVRHVADLSDKLQLAMLGIALASSGNLLDSPISKSGARASIQTTEQKIAQLKSELAQLEKQKITMKRRLESIDSSIRSNSEVGRKGRRPEPPVGVLVSKTRVSRMKQLDEDSVVSFSRQRSDPSVDDDSSYAGSRFARRKKKKLRSKRDDGSSVSRGRRRGGPDDDSSVVSSRVSRASRSRTPNRKGKRTKRKRKKKADGQLHAGTRTFEIQPGKIGWVRSMEDNMIGNVHKNTQAERLGVQPGWRIIAVNGRASTSKKLAKDLDAVKKQFVKFTLTFRMPEPDYIHEPRLNSKAE